MSSFLYFFHPQNLAKHNHIFSIVIFLFLLTSSFFFFYKKKKEKTLLINIAVFLSLIIPIIFYFETRSFKIMQKWTPLKTTSSSFFAPDNNLGQRANQGEWKEEVFENEKLLYTALYSIDQYGFRMENPKSSNDYILLYGCSNSFGQGVNNNETFSMLIENGKKHQSINLSMIGSSTSHMLQLIQTQSERNYLKKDPRYAIYTFIPGHLARNTFSLSWQNQIPWYELDGKGKLSPPQLKTLEKDLTITLFFKHWSSFFLEHLRPSAISYSPYQIQLFKTLILESQKKLMARYPKIKFKVILLQHDSFSKYNLKEIEETLKNAGIEFIDFENLAPECFKQPLLCKFKDGHLNKLGHKKLAQVIKTKILYD